MRAAPAVSCAMCTRRCAHEHTGQRRTSDIPCAMALRLITCSPRRTALLPPLRPERLLPPGALTPAPRRQDHTSLPYASNCARLSQLPRPPLPVPRCDDGQRPSEWDGMDVDIVLIWSSGKAKYFLFRGLT